MKTFDNHTAGIQLSRLVILATAMLLTTTAGASETGPRYTMTIIENTAHSSKIARGSYAKAIKGMTAHNYQPRDTFAEKTNLCVAYTKSGDFNNAVIACDEAIVEIRQQYNRVRNAYARRDDEPGHAAYLAVALSNRGVLHAISGDAELARSAFTEALQLRAGVSAPRTNLAKLAAVAPAFD